MKKEPKKQPKKAEQTIKVEDLEPRDDVKGGRIVSADGDSAARKQEFHDALITEITFPNGD